MDRVKVYIGNKAYNCEVAKTEEQKTKGLLDKEFLPADEGMLFEWKEADDRPMHMKDMKFPIDQIGINEDDEVVIVYQAQPTEEQEDVIFPKCKYILEVNINSGIVEGDEFEIDDEEDLNKYTMKVLAPDGSTQMLLQGGERIFSRISTRKIIKWAKKAQEVRKDEKEFTKKCKRLGKTILKELHAQDNRDPEYVQVPE